MGGPQAAPPAAPGAQMPGFLATLNRAELIMAAGAALILLVDVVFVIFGPYGFSPIAWAAAALTLILIFMSGRMLSFSAATLRSLLLLLGSLIVVTAVRDILADVEYLTSPGSLPAAWLLGAIGYYVGVGLMIFGAWTLWKSKAA